MPYTYNYYVDQNPTQFCSANENQSDHVTVILVGRSEINSSENIWKEFDASWNELKLTNLKLQVREIKFHAKLWGKVLSNFF